jgi:hypothetical protein
VRQLVDVQGRKFIATQGSWTCACGPFSVSVPNAKTLMLAPAPYPTCPSWCKVSMWLAPLQSCCEFPDILYEEYSDTIADGAASRLLMQPKQDYTNIGLGRQLSLQYQIGVTRAKNKRVMEHTTGPILMRGPTFERRELRYELLHPPAVVSGSWQSGRGVVRVELRPVRSDAQALCGLRLHHDHAGRNRRRSFGCWPARRTAPDRSGAGGDLHRDPLAWVQQPDRVATTRSSVRLPDSSASTGIRRSLRSAPGCT